MAYLSLKQQAPTSPQMPLSINKTIQHAHFNFVYPYHAQIPSFGDWGFIMASKHKQKINTPM